MRIYATVDDIYERLGLSPEQEPQVLPHNKALSLLRSASLLVENATRLATYDVDTNGLPTEPKIIEAFKLATLQQIATWYFSNIDPDKGGVGQTAQISSQSVDGGSVSYSGAVSAQELGYAATSLTDLAVEYLRSAGLLNRSVRYLR